MTEPMQTFWLDPSDEVVWGLRRYSRDDRCADGKMHDALVYLGFERAVFYEGDDGRMHRKMADDRETPHDDRRWPTKCGSCDYTFVGTDSWQDWDQLVYVRRVTGERYVLHDFGAPDLGCPTAPPGACWDAWWRFGYEHLHHYPEDPFCLMVRCPDGHDWCVDSEASNCTRKNEEHHCWVRHGYPPECNVTVDKNDPNTCHAGAGSIQTPGWHGFLRDGILVEA